MQNSDLTLHAIASQEHVTPGYISRLLRQGQKSASAYRQEAYATSAGVAGRLDRTAQAAWIPISGLTTPTIRYLFLPGSVPPGLASYSS
jgi:hypothetical protein